MAVSATNPAVLNAPAPPAEIHSCPACSHWLPDGTLACPDCRTLTYGQYLSQLAMSAQQLEQDQKWPEARARWEMALGWLPSDTQQAASIVQHVAQIDARLKAEADYKAKWTRRLGPFAPALFFLMKAKSWLFLVFKAKFLLGFLSYFGIYWLLLGWKFAAGFTASILIHEMGHYVAVRRRGLKADLPMLLPGMGAYVRWYGEGVSREDLAAIALAGPLYGLTAALACFAIYWGTHLPLFLVLAYFGAWINLINLVPVLGLDGARAVYALSQMQRGLLAATCLVFFALTLGPAVSFENAEWVFAIVGAGLLWKTLVRDTPEKGHTATFALFQGLLIVLGMLVAYTSPLMAQMKLR